MSDAITWVMNKRQEPPPGSLLARGTLLEVCFIAMPGAAVRLAWDGTGWEAQWGRYGPGAQQAAVQETEQFEHRGFALAGPIYAARTHLSASGLYSLSSRGVQVQLVDVLPGDWLAL